MTTLPKWWHRGAGLLLVAGSVSMGPSSIAQTRPAAKPAAPLSADQIRQRAASIKEARGLLNDPEPTIRMAAFDQMTNSNDTVLQEVAYETAFSSGDASLRTFALRRRLMQMASVAVEITEVVLDPRRTDRSPASEVASRNVTWFVAATDEKSGVLIVSERPATETDARRAGTSITVSGLTVAINGRNAYPGCQGAMRLDDSNVLVGQMTCTGIPVNGSQPILKIRAQVT